MQDIFQELCMEPRPAGGDRIKQVRKYIMSFLGESAYSIIQDKHPFIAWQLIEEPKFMFTSPIEMEIRCLPVVWSGTTNGNVVGKLQPSFNIMRTFEAYGWQLYNIVDSDGMTLANVLTRPDMVWAQPLDSERQSPDIPYLILEKKAAKYINRWIVDKKEIEVKMSVKSRLIPNREIENIIVSSEKIDSDIIVSTHYDSMFNTVGAHDNASGTIALIKLIQHFSKNIPNHLKFIFFDAEEWNKTGAYCYVNKLKKRRELDRIKLIVNIDSVGVGNHLYMLTSPSIEQSIKKIVEETGKHSVIRIEDISSRPEFPQFDTWPFMKNKIPVIQIGTRGKRAFKYFHDPLDKKINFKLMKRVVNFLEVFLDKISKTYLT